MVCAGRDSTVSVRKLYGWQDDYLNPTDFARTMNSLVPYELAGQGVLIFILAMNWLLSFSSLKFFLLFVMGTHAAVQGMR